MGVMSLDIATYLAQQGFGAVGTDIFVGRMLEKPSKQIIIHDAGAYRPTDFQCGESYPMVSITVRGVDSTKYEATHAIIESIRNMLCVLPQLEVSGRHYGGFWPYTDIIYMGYDKGERPNFTMVIRSIVGI